MKKWCKYCGRELTKTEDLMGIWSDPDALIFCFGYDPKPTFHVPMDDNDMVTKILTKYTK